MLRTSAEGEVVGLDAWRGMQGERSGHRRAGLVEGVKPGRAADIDGLRMVTVDGDIERAGATQHEVDVLGEEPEFQLGSVARGGFLRMVGPGPGQSDRADRKRRGELVDGWR